MHLVKLHFIEPFRNIAGIVSSAILLAYVDIQFVALIPVKCSMNEVVLNVPHGYPSIVADFECHAVY